MSSSIPAFPSRAVGGRVVRAKIAIFLQDKDVVR